MVSILDHLAYRLFVKGGTGGAGRHVYFPISRNATNSTEHEADCKRKVKGMLQPVIDALLAVEAYKGGKGNELWVLNELNNLSKHRDLIAVGSRFRSLDLGVYTTGLFRKNIDASFPGIEFPELSAFFRPANPLCPLKVGDELFIGAPDDEVNEKMQFRFDIALNEPQIIQAEPLIETIHHFADLVNKIVDQFVPFL
jgi:hypothetical protein